MTQQRSGQVAETVLPPAAQPETPPAGSQRVGQETYTSYVHVHARPPLRPCGSQGKHECLRSVSEHPNSEPNRQFLRRPARIHSANRLSRRRLLLPHGMFRFLVPGSSSFLRAVRGICSSARSSSTPIFPSSYVTRIRSLALYPTAPDITRTTLRRPTSLPRSVIHRFREATLLNSSLEALYPPVPWLSPRITLDRVQPSKFVQTFP